MSELIITDSERVASGRTMNTTATLFRDGTLKLHNVSKSVHMSKGLRGHSLFAIIVHDGRALYLSKVHFPRTVASQGDLFNDSEQITNFVEHIPEPIAKIATRIDVVHNRGNLNNSWKQMVENIKQVTSDANDVTDEIKELVKKLYP